MTTAPAAPAAAITLPEAPRLGRFFERRGSDDLPFYDDQPIHIATWKWLVIIASCVAGFFVLTLTPEPNDIGSLLPRTLFMALPLATLIVFTGRYWTRLFRRFTWRDAGTAVFFAFANTAVTAAIAIVVRTFFGSTANSAPLGVLDGGPAGVVAFYVGTGLQLVGEELFTILPFLAIVYWLFSKAGLSRNSAIIIAWLATAVWFGAAHLPTYGWNFAQALLVIGSARLVLTLAYLRTKNLGVSIAAHILNDWMQFTFVIVGTAAAGAVALF
ncbi:CPBP family intramembrane metalloprotease [Microbacterium sp. W1N]|uniref:CPBP family intramembrane glutamic endopeptidase n=1 Tax=Microbacterium festucae TaxID=2977531 RepID=UPI0021C0B4E9|nr:CPBP family intramembrane glutamic endopeptidase [Microbacterium festucae]MCT9821267.1 CPBP family intramembrane metalloprotease [Microbacterium festucae]